MENSFCRECNGPTESSTGLCKKCYNKQWRSKNKEHIKKYRERTKQRTKAYYLANIENRKKYNKQYYLENKERIKSKTKAYAQAHPEWKKEYDKEYNRTHREQNRIRSKKWRENPFNKLHNNISRKIYRSLKNKSYTKELKWNRLVNYSTSDLKKHIEKQFVEGMSWDNYGSEWHIDHKIPVSWFNTKEELLNEAWALKNLQPLWAKENISKGNRYASI